MSWDQNVVYRRTIAVATLLAASLSCQAATYSLSQSGFSAGGSISGSFQGEDRNGDGVIASFNGEVASFSLAFSGNSLVPSFTYGLLDLQGLVYEVGTPFIGDSGGRVPFGEGIIAVRQFPIRGYQYNSGLLPIVDRGAAFFSPTQEFVESSRQLLSVSQVPEPGASLLMFVGLLVVAGLSRRVGA